MPNSALNGSEQFHVKEFANGLTLLGQHMEQVSSAAMTFAIPAGASHDPTGCEGAASVASEWCLRGAGELDTRQLHDALDSLGCQHNESISSKHISFTAAQLGRNLHDILGVYADIIRRPALDDETFGPCRALTQQDLASLEDEPARKCNIILHEKFYPFPLGRETHGMAESLEKMSADVLRTYIRSRLAPSGAILALAGNIDWPALCDMVDELFGDWSGASVQDVQSRPADAGVTHIYKDSAQTHIGLAHRSVPMSHDHYYAARMAETVLSAGMSSRLFTEVREKRALVYHVSSRYHSLKGHAGMFTYAGTVPEKAQETFDVTVGELKRLGEGVEKDELARARTQLKSAVVMQGESTAARASALAGDWYHLKRLRSLNELSAAIDAVTNADVMAYLKDFPAENFTILVVGPEAVETAAADS